MGGDGIEPPTPCV